MRSNVDAREFDQRIRFEAQANERSSSGAVIPSWSEVVTCWGRVDAVMARERMAAAELHQVDAYTIWVRADVISRNAIDTSMRAVWRGKPYDIVSISDNTDRGRKTAVFVQGGLSNG